MGKWVKRVLSSFLAVLLTYGAIHIGIISVAANNGTPVTISANSTSPITIKGADGVDGVLSLSGGTHSISRDYDQNVTVSVTNNTSAAVAYYLSIKNGTGDLATDFSGSGSEKHPSVIGPGATQPVKLTIFAQNATQASYSFPITAYLVGEDGAATADATNDVRINCQTVDLSVACTLQSIDPQTLAQTWMLTNNGAYLSDLSVALLGDAAGYAQLNPTVSEYPMEHNASVSFTLWPDIAKMDKDSKTSLTGKLVASCGGKQQEFPLTIVLPPDTMKTITMGELSAWQTRKYKESQMKDDGAEGPFDNATPITKGEWIKALLSATEATLIDDIFTYDCFYADSQFSSYMGS